MAWFKDKTTKAKDYMQATENVSRPMAVLFTIIIFFIGIAVVFCLFLGGKWIYQQFTDEKGTTTQIESGQQTSQSSSSQQQSTQSTQNQNSNQTTSPNNQAANTSNQNQSQQSTTTPATGPSEVPNTGPSPE